VAHPPIDHQLSSDLITALAASAAVVVLMAFTFLSLLTKGRRSKNKDFQPESIDVRSSILRIACLLLLTFFSLILVARGVAASIGKGSISEIWQSIERAALAEALVLAYSHILKRDSEG
jgi:Na+-driven multidrug efflux pump